MRSLGLSKNAMWMTVLIVWALGRAGTSAEEPQYILTDLGSLSGTEVTYGYGISPFGDAVGQSSGHAFLWTSPGPMIDLGTLGGSTSSAIDVNDVGEVVGYSLDIHGQTFGFYWTDADDMISVGALDRGKSSWANAINSAGVVVGESTTDGYLRDTAHAFQWTVDDGLVDMGTLGGLSSGAYDINDFGEMTGRSKTETGTCDHAYFQADTDSEMVDLETLGGLCSYGYALNNDGHVVGTSTLSGTADYRGFLWTPDRGMINLGTLNWWSWAYDINDYGEIVGSSQTNPSQIGSEHAVIWLDEVIYDLNDLIEPGSSWVLNAAVAINNSGQIVGSGRIGNQKRAFLLTPVVSGPDGDFDGDGLVDWFDYVAFSTCMDGPGIPPDPPDPFTEEQCLEAFDSEVDGDIDLADFAWFTTVFEG